MTASHTVPRHTRPWSAPPFRSRAHHSGEHEERPMYEVGVEVGGARPAAGQGLDVRAHIGGGVIYASAAALPWRGRPPGRAPARRARASPPHRRAAPPKRSAFCASICAGSSTAGQGRRRQHARQLLPVEAPREDLARLRAAVDVQQQVVDARLHGVVQGGEVRGAVAAPAAPAGRHRRPGATHACGGDGPRCRAHAAPRRPRAGRGVRAGAGLAQVIPPPDLVVQPRERRVGRPRPCTVRGAGRRHGPCWRCLSAGSTACLHRSRGLPLRLGERGAPPRVELGAGEAAGEGIGVARVAEYADQRPSAPPTHPCAPKRPQKGGLRAGGENSGD